MTVAGQRLAWTDRGVSFAPGSEAALARLNEEMAKGAEGVRSQFQLVPGRVWHDKDGTHVQSGFLAMGHRPVVTENNPGQKLSYALSVVSARAVYSLEEPEADAGLGDELPSPPAVEVPPAPAPNRAAAASSDSAPPPAPAGVALGPAVRLAGDTAGLPSVASDAGATVAPAPGAGEGQVALVPVGPGAGLTARGAPLSSTFGRGAARSLRSGIGLVALAGLAAAAAVLRAARRQLALIGTSGEDG